MTDKKKITEEQHKPVDYEGEVSNPTGFSDKVQVKLGGKRQAFFPKGVDGPNPEHWGEEQTLLPMFENDLINDPSVDGPNPEVWSPEAVAARIHDGLPPCDGGTEGDETATWAEYMASLPVDDES
jgi:hypothetical protein